MIKRKIGSWVTIRTGMTSQNDKSIVGYHPAFERLGGKKMRISNVYDDCGNNIFWYKVEGETVWLDETCFKTDNIDKTCPFICVSKKDGKCTIRPCKFLRDYNRGCNSNR